MLSKKEKDKRYLMTLKGIITMWLKNHKYSCKRSGIEKPTYTKKEFAHWLKNDTNLLLIWDIYINSGRKKLLKPVCYRKNTRRPYTLKNLKVTTKKERDAEIKTETHTKRRISTKTRFIVLERDNFSCKYCGRKPPNVILHVDHIRPWSKGGLTKESNLVTACIDCNLGKGDKVI